MPAITESTGWQAFLCVSMRSAPNWRSGTLTHSKAVAQASNCKMGLYWIITQTRSVGWRKAAGYYGTLSEALFVLCSFKSAPDNYMKVPEKVSLTLRPRQMWWCEKVNSRKTNARINPLTTLKDINRYNIWGKTKKTPGNGWQVFKTISINVWTLRPPFTV